MIAAGDLDGDSYFVCWDDAILNSIKENAVRSANPKVKSKLAQDCRTLPEGDWLSMAQDVMVDIEWFVSVNQLKGKLWGAAKQQAHSSSHFMNDHLAIQLARAYKLSLDLSKQGGQLDVPEEVRKKLPKSLHAALSPTSEVHGVSST